MSELSLTLKNHRHIQMFFSHLEPIARYLEDPGVTEIMVNAPNDIWIEQSGQMMRVEGLSLDGVNLEAATRILANLNDKDLAPVLDARMPGFRIAVALKPVAIKGSSLCIRKHTNSNRTLDDYLDDGAFDMPARQKEAGHKKEPDDLSNAQALRAWLTRIVCERRNVVIAGSTGSGKTTFLNAMLNEIPAQQRVVTIEDTAELKINVPNHVAFETYEEGDITIRALVRLALRYRPDRIIVGEVRGGEVYDLIDAMITGHPGGFCTLHAGSPLSALHRIESMLRMSPQSQNLPLSAVRKMIAETVDIVIYCERRGEKRGPVEIAEVLGIRGDEYQINTLFST